MAINLSPLPYIECPQISPKEQETLNRQLFSTLKIEQNDKTREKDCRTLVASRADPNCKDSCGLTPLKKALRRKDIYLTKLFIDLLAKPDAEDRKNILELLAANQTQQIDIFLMPRPAPAESQILFNDRFMPLDIFVSDYASQIERLPKRIAIFNIADELIFKHYGGVSYSFSPEWSRKFIHIKKEYIVISALITNRTDPFTVVTKIFPTIPVLYLHFRGHANSQAIDFGRSITPSETFTRGCPHTMLNFSPYLSKQAVIGLGGCCIAKEKGNIASIFSESLDGRLVCAPRDYSCDATYYLGADSRLQHPFIFPIFNSNQSLEDKNLNSDVVVYSWGKELISMNQPIDRPIPQAVFEEITQALLKRREEKPSSTAADMCAVS